jgi:hypothetical protein
LAVPTNRPLKRSRSYEGDALHDREDEMTPFLQIKRLSEKENA